MRELHPCRLDWPEVTLKSPNATAALAEATAETWLPAGPLVWWAEPRPRIPARGRLGAERGFSWLRVLTDRAQLVDLGDELVKRDLELDTWTASWRGGALQVAQLARGPRGALHREISDPAGDILRRVEHAWHRIHLRRFFPDAEDGELRPYELRTYEKGGNVVAWHLCTQPTAPSEEHH